MLTKTRPCVPATNTFDPGLSASSAPNNYDLISTIMCGGLFSLSKSLLCMSHTKQLQERKGERDAYCIMFLSSHSTPSLIVDPEG